MSQFRRRDKKKQELTLQTFYEILKQLLRRLQILIREIPHL